MQYKLLVWNDIYLNLAQKLNDKNRKMGYYKRKK